MPLSLLLAATIGIIVIHSVVIWTYAGLYLTLHAFRNFQEALYFSTVTYASIGYGDLLMPNLGGFSPPSRARQASSCSDGRRRFSSRFWDS